RGRLSRVGSLTSRGNFARSAPSGPAGVAPIGELSPPAEAYRDSYESPGCTGDDGGEGTTPCPSTRGSTSTATATPTPTTRSPTTTVTTRSCITTRTATWTPSPTTTTTTA